MTGLFGAAPEPMSLWAMLGGGLLAFVSPCVLPMLAVMLMYQWLKGALGWLRNHQQIIRRIGGGLMIAYGAYLVIRTLV